MQSTPLPAIPKSDSAMAPPEVGGPLESFQKGWSSKHRIPYILSEPVDDVDAGEIEFPEVARTAIKASKLHVMHRVRPVRVNVGAAFLFTYSWAWGLFCPSKETNPHWHTSLLKRWLCSFVRAKGYDAYSFAGQAWLDNPSDGPAVLVGALSTGYLNQNFRALTSLGIPILAVVEDYQEGYHADAEYTYTCIRGIVKGHSTGKKQGWYDENIFSEWRDGPVGDGWFIHTIASLGPQRVVVFDTFESPNAVKNDPFPTDVSEARGSTSRMSCPTKLDLEIPVEDEKTGLPRYAPSAYRSLRVWPWRRSVTWMALLSLLVFSSTMLMMYCGMHRIPHLGTVIAFICVVAALITVLSLLVLCRTYQPYSSEDLCPEYHLVDNDAEDFISWCSGVHKFAHKGYTLPPGFYHIDEKRVIRVPPSHPDCNYTNLVAMAEQYCASKSWNPKTGVRKLVRLFGPIPEAFFQVSSADINVKEPAMPPDLVRTIPVRVKINPSEPKIRIACLDYNHEDFTLPVPDTQSIASTATTRVFQRIQEAPALDRLLNFWNVIVRGGRIPFNPDPPDFSRYAGPKRRLYQATYDKLCARKPAHYSSFLKIECLPSANIEAGKAIRAIEPNSKSFNVSTFNFFHDFEKTLLATKDRWGYDLFAKGSNMDTRCSVIAQKAAKYRYVYSCDFKNFDGHHKGKAYTDEIEFYMRIGLDRFYQPGLVKSQLDGLYEAAQPKRHSGDLFTGSGNCLVVASMLYWEGCEHTIYCDGDDTLVFTNDVNLIKQLVQRAKDAGHVLTVEEPRTGPFGVEIPFCQHVFCGEVYWPSQKRICNKLFNIPYSSQEDLAKRLYGKLCALSAYIKAGVLKMPEFACPVDDDIIWRYNMSVRIRPEPTSDPTPAGPITSLLRTLVEKCPPRDNNGLPSVINGAERAVKLVVHQFLNSDPTFKPRELPEESFGTRFLRWVTPVSRSEMFSSQFGSANFVDCTRHTNCTASKSLSSLPTTLSPMVFSQSRTTTTQAKAPPTTPRQCSSKQAQGKNESTRPSKSQSRQPSSGPRRPGDLRKDRTATSSTLTSGSPQATQSNQSASTSSTKPASTHHKQQVREQIPHQQSQASETDNSSKADSSAAATNGTSASAPATRTNSPRPGHQERLPNGKGGSGSQTRPPDKQPSQSRTSKNPKGRRERSPTKGKTRSQQVRRSPSQEARRHRYFQDSRSRRNRASSK